MAVDTAGAGSGVRPPEARAPGGPGRLSFRAKVALVWAGIFLVLAIFFWLADFDVAWIREWAPFILKGVWVTVTIAAAAIVLAIVLALFGALGRLSTNPIAYAVSGFYTSFFRGTPLIVQLFLVYLGLPQVAQGLQLSPGLYRYTVLSAVFAGTLVLGFNYGAYMTEIFRAGIQSVGGGQTEAADALGMSYRQRMRRVVLPQAFKVVIPPTANEFIAMTKDTALIGFLGTTVFWWDVFKRAQQEGQQQFHSLEALLIAAGLYWTLTIILTYFQSKLERKIGRGYVREAGSATKSSRGPRRFSGGEGGADRPELSLGQPGLPVTAPEPEPGAEP
jgi:polar amino acid transport system permease protein